MNVFFVSIAIKYFMFVHFFKKVLLFVIKINYRLMSANCLGVFLVNFDPPVTVLGSVLVSWVSDE